MKKLFYIACIVAAIISFTGCYSGRAVFVSRPPVGRVIIGSPYRPAPIIVGHYYGYHGGHGGYRGWSHGYHRY